MAPPRPARSHSGAAAGHAVEWSAAPGPVLYPDAVEAMEERVAAILARQAPEQVWLLEHPPLYTAGTSARADDLLDSLGLPVYRSGRGGQYTYHGPGPARGLRHARPGGARGAWTCAASSATSNNG